MAPAKAKRMKTGVKVPPEIQEMEPPPDLGRPENNPRLYNPAHHLFTGLFDEDTRNKFYNRLERCQGRVNMLIHKRRLSFKKSVTASFKAMHQIVEKSLKTGNEQRRAFYLNYYQKSLIVFQKWEHHLQKVKKCEKNIAKLSEVQKQLAHYVEMLRTEKMKQLRTLYEAFLKSMNSLKTEQRKLAEEQGGFTKEMAMLQQESMKQAHQDLASILKRFQPRLGVILKKKPNCGGITESHDRHTKSTRL